MGHCSQPARAHIVTLHGRVTPVELQPLYAHPRNPTFLIYCTSLVRHHGGQDHGARGFT